MLDALANVVGELERGGIASRLGPAPASGAEEEPEEEAEERAEDPVVEAAAAASPKKRKKRDRSATDPVEKQP